MILLNFEMISHNKTTLMEKKVGTAGSDNEKKDSSQFYLPLETQR